MIMKMFAAGKSHKETNVEYMTLLMELNRQRKGGWGERSDVLALDMLQDYKPSSRVMKYTRLTKEQIEKIAQAHHLTLNKS